MTTLERSKRHFDTVCSVSGRLTPYIHVFVMQSSGFFFQADKANEYSSAVNLSLNTHRYVDQAAVVDDANS